MSRPEDFKTIDAKDGITIRKPGRFYEVHHSEGFYDSATELYDAMLIVEDLRKDILHIRSLSEKRARHENSQRDNPGNLAATPESHES